MEDAWVGISLLRIEQVYDNAREGLEIKSWRFFTEGMEAASEVTFSVNFTGL